MPELLYKAYIDYEILEDEYERTRQLYERLLDRTKYLKVWISYAQFEASADMKDEEIELLCKAYIDSEISGDEYERTTQLYERLLDRTKYLKIIEIEHAGAIFELAIAQPTLDIPELLCKTYIDYEISRGEYERTSQPYERSLSEMERARAIFELVIAQPTLDMPELLYKVYIDNEILGGKYERTRQLYERLLDRTKHCYMKYAELKRSLSEIERTRVIFELTIIQPTLDMPELLCKAYIDYEILGGEYERTR
uniref:Crooked neck-like protein 1 n=1 Tax=Elaeis guineensis var. tenera TaxID=51953 RepID=A0A6I9QU76_ELAGV|nr:crooked neck-like protein 1 [Elaeis guineensis]